MNINDYDELMYEINTMLNEDYNKLMHEIDRNAFTLIIIQDIMKDMSNRISKIESTNKRYKYLLILMIIIVLFTAFNNGGIK